MRTLVIAEHEQGGLRSATLSTINAAKALELPIDIIILGDALGDVIAQTQKISGISKIIAGETPLFAAVLAETYAEAVLSIANDYAYLLAPATTFGKNLLPRVAARMDVQQISDVIAIETPRRFIRPIYAGNALQTVETEQEKNLLTIRGTSFSPVAILEQGQDTPVEKKEFTVTKPRSAFISREGSKSERPELTSARIVVSGGRGVGSKENFKIIEELADDLNAAVGASRAAVDAGYVPNDYQVGQTGKIVAPDLYLAIGISGAIQHLAGMIGAKTVVAINKDADAPIFQIADYGLVGDLFEILPALRDELKRVF